MVSEIEFVIFTESCFPQHSATIKLPHKIAKIISAIIYTIAVVALIAPFAQSATATAGLRAPKDNFEAKRIPIVSANPIENAP